MLAFPETSRMVRNREYSNGFLYLHAYDLGSFDARAPFSSLPLADTSHQEHHSGRRMGRHRRLSGAGPSLRRLGALVGAGAGVIAGSPEPALR